MNVAQDFLWVTLIDLWGTLLLYRNQSVHQLTGFYVSILLFG